MRFALLPLAVLILLLSGQSAAQDDLLLGGLELEVQAGYSGYALPVANSALGRDWAEQGPLSWQMGLNYSTVPVRIAILHRRADAFRGSIELISTAGYSVSEDPLGHSASITTDFVVPPSVPYTISLAPRVCPPSNPGGPARLLLRIYQQGLQAPVVSEVITVTQLEPAYLYSLLLDGPPGNIVDDPVNPGNLRQLDLGPNFDPVDGVLSTRNWLISCPHEQLTGLPLAARDFAFVAADFGAVRNWDAAEQLALMQFVIGGGHLCLFNVTGSEWRGLQLNADALPVGRGILRIVRAGLPEARTAMADWLGGELEEFVLWCGGAAAGRSLPMAQSSENLLHYVKGERLRQLLSAGAEADIASHRPGFLHPLWIYREACLSGALEPWQGPEFVINEAGAWQYNEILRTSIGSISAGNVEPLAYAAAAPRKLPSEWRWLTLALPGCLLLWGLITRGRMVLLLLAAALFGWLAWAWSSTAPPLAEPIEVRVLDAAAGAPVTNLRTLSAAETGWGGNVRLPLGQSPLIRQLAWRDREGQWAGGDWNLDLSGATPVFNGAGGGSYLAVTCDTPGPPAEALPVTLSARRIDDQRIRLEAAGSALTPDSLCFLLSPLGWLSLPSGNGGRSLELQLPLAPMIPGQARLAAWQSAFDNWYERFGRQSTLVGVENAALLRQVDDSYHAGKLTTAEFYALLGALQQSSGHRATLANQVVLYCLLPPADGDPPTRATVLRLALSLEGLHGGT